MAVRKSWAQAHFIIHLSDKTCARVVVSGRDRWALECLIAAGQKGCTPIDTPGPRWSGYVFNLRALGVPIETVKEAHGGDFSGTHARYVLSAPVTRDSEVNA